MVKLTPGIQKCTIILLLIALFQSEMVNGQNAGSEDGFAVNFSHNRNIYNESFQLVLNTGNVEATIVYTLDSSTPSISNGQIYSDGIFIESSTVVKAFAYTANSTAKVVTHTFIFPTTVANQGKQPTGFPAYWGGSSVIPADYEMDPEIINHPDYQSEISKALLSIPSVSLTMNVDEWFNYNTGLYVGYQNTNVTREKPVTAEFLFNDTSENFSVECGVQNQGGTSIVKWKVPKQSMRLLFKGMYGPKKLNYKLFPNSDIESINTLVLDGLLYSWLHPWDNTQRITSLYFRDQLASDMQNKMGWSSFHGIYVNLFINGLYWGIYDLHERPDEDFMEEYLGADKDEFDIIKHNPNDIVQGSNRAYLEMLDLARKGLGSSTALTNIQKYLDLPAFIDYMILNFYLGNYDWAHQNFYAARNNVKNTGFRFYTWDAEHVMRYSDVDYNNLKKNDEGGPTEIHTLLKQNTEYRMMFADAIYRHLFNDGALTPESFEESFLFRKNEIESAVTLESARWGDYREDKSGITYTKNDFWIPEVNNVLRNYIPYRRNVLIDQLQSHSPKLFPSNMPPDFVVDNQSSGLQKMIELINPNSEEGNIYYTLDGSDPRAASGAVHGILYTDAILIEYNSIIKTRFLPKNSTEWSALAERSFEFDFIYGEEVVINEIMYHPISSSPEFIELVNIGETSVKLDGFVFSNGIEYTFQAGSNLLPGNGLVLTNDSTLFRSAYGYSAFGQYSKKLSNDGETLILENRYRQIIDSVSYSNTIPWPVLADGEGYSLELIDQKADNSVFSNWTISDFKVGAPYELLIAKELETVLYPNPFTNKITIEIRNQELVYETFIIEVFNLFGSKVKTIETVSENSKIQIPTGNLNQGLYVIQIQTKDKPPGIVKKLKALKL